MQVSPTRYVVCAFVFLVMRMVPTRVMENNPRKPMLAWRSISHNGGVWTDIQQHFQVSDVTLFGA